MSVNNIFLITPKFENLDTAHYPVNDTSFFAGTIIWLKASNEACKTLAVFFSIFLGLATVAIIRFAFTAIVWKKQEAGQQSTLKVQKIVEKHLESANVVVTETPQVVGESNLALQTLQPWEFLEVLNEVVLEKQPQIVTINSKYGTVDLKDLMKNGLLPTKKMTLGNVNYFCSKPFKLEVTHDAVIALVEIDNQVFPRVFYHSNSQGTWRVMPFARKVSLSIDEPKKIIHPGKGGGETDTQLPVFLTCALNNLYDSVQSDNYLAGSMLQTELGQRELPLFLNRIFMDETKSLREGDQTIPFPPNPTDMQLPNDERPHPDFSNKFEFKQAIPHYGAIFVRIFPSKDKRLMYLFYETEDERAFLASVEFTQGVGINSFGVREKIVNIEHMDASLLEYFNLISRSFLPADPFNNRYQSRTYHNNWNYVRELPIIQEYYKQQGRVLPISV